jgi:hypothetical protein
MMHAAEFARRFRDHQEIGREVTDTHLLVFYDNGEEVGLWRENRRTTQGVGDVLSPSDGEMARYWYRNGIGKWVETDRGTRVNEESSPHIPPVDR